MQLVGLSRHVRPFFEWIYDSIILHDVQAMCTAVMQLLLTTAGLDGEASRGQRAERRAETWFEQVYRYADTLSKVIVCIKTARKNTSTRACLFGM
jgi:hypothetical protein